MENIFQTVLVLIFATICALLFFTDFFGAGRTGRTGRTSSIVSKNGKKPAPTIVSASPARNQGSFALEEVAKHNTREDCWIIVDGSVYDVTSYVEDHPGGDSILNNAGKDSSEGVHGPQHPVSMYDVLALYKIGELSK